MIILFISLIYSSTGVSLFCNNYPGCTRIPLGLAPLKIVLTNKKVGTHALTVYRRTITQELGYTMVLKKLNYKDINKQTFEIRIGGRDNFVLDYEDKGYYRDLTLYSRYGELYVGSTIETINSMPIYLRINHNHIYGNEIVLFRLIAGNRCLGLRAVSRLDDYNQIYLPVFKNCFEDAEDQLWSVFLKDLVKDRMDYDRKLITKRYFQDKQHYFQTHVWPTLKLLLDKMDLLGREYGAL